MPAGISRYSFLTHVSTWVKTFDDFGIGGLKHSSASKVWTVEQRFELVSKVLAGNSVNSIARNAYINNGQLHQWVKRYREKGIDGLQLKKGRKQTNTLMPKKKVKLIQTEQEELKLLSVNDTKKS